MIDSHVPYTYGGERWGDERALIHARTETHALALLPATTAEDGEGEDEAWERPWPALFLLSRDAAAGCEPTAAIMRWALRCVEL